MQPSSPPPPPAPPPLPPGLYGHSAGCADALGTARTVVPVTDVPLNTPTALAWHPTRPGELWLTSRATDSITVLNTTSMASHQLGDRAPYHYMDQVSSISFDALGQFATCQESLNTYEGTMRPNFFMGPTLYDSRLNLIDSRQQPCEHAGADSRLTDPSADVAASDEEHSCFLIHTDMLHESPLCMGIVHDAGSTWTNPQGVSYQNVYWTYDAGHRQLVRFDFESDHGPGSMDHSLAAVRRYTGVELSYVEGVPAHMALDAASRELFVADPGHNRLLRVHVDSGAWLEDAKPLFPIYSSPEASFNYTVWSGLQWDVLGTVSMPSGLALTASVVYVGSHSLGEVYAFDRASRTLLQVVAAAQPYALRGLALSPLDGALWMVHGDAGLAHVHVDTACPASATTTASSCSDGVLSGDETGVDCGGRVCARCASGGICAVGNDCETGVCSSGVCGAASSSHGNTANFLWTYLDSPWYQDSFAHHMINGDMGGASYLNPYPIMDATFCATVGTVNGSGVGPVDCSTIDFDSLLLGGCWCHECLPVNPCRNSGVCNNYNFQGYTCDCADTGYHGDHCHLASHPSPPPPQLPSPSPPPSPSTSPPSPPSVSPTSSNVASDDDDDDDQMALIVGLTVSFGVVTLLVVGMAVVMMRGRAQARRQLKSTAPADVKKPGAPVPPPVSSTEMIDVQKVPPQMQAA